MLSVHLLRKVGLNSINTLRCSVRNSLAQVSIHRTTLTDCVSRDEKNMSNSNVKLRDKLKDRDWSGWSYNVIVVNKIKTALHS